jgi:PAS domain S-box-containing protein
VPFGPVKRRPLAGRDREQVASEPQVADVPEALRAETEGRTRAILDAALDCVVSIDHRGLITYFNPAAEETFGYRSEQAVGTELAEVILPPSLRDAHRAGFARHLETGETRILGQRIELIGMRGDGSEFPVELTVTRIDAPGAPLFTAYLRDITDRRTAEQELRAAHSRLQSIAAEQTALRHVATLVAEGAKPSEVFDAVCEQTGLLFGATRVNLAHFTPDGYSLTMAGWSLHDTHIPAGTRLPLNGETVHRIVRRTGRPARIETYEGVDGELAALLRTLGICCDVGAPVFVDGEVWGALMAGSDGSVQFPADAEARLADVTNLIATAISNAESQSALASSRRRIVTAADETRRRIERNLHDGTQQQLVSLALELRAAQTSVPRELHELGAELTRIGDGMGAVQEELREIARGIHPAILAEGGLAPALRTLARRSACPVKLDVPIEERLPEPVEVAIYYIVSEALTNAAKHAHASVVEVDVEAMEGVVSASVRDDGDGGADPERGSGLIGLTDRVEALGGSLAVQSPRGGGTHLHVEIPLDATRS